MKTQEIIDALYKYYRQRGYLCLHELRPGTGYSAGGAAGGIDFWCMHQWPSERFTRVSIEIKVSRSDYLREKRDPRKQDSALRHSNLLYFAAPVGLISAWELRSDAGLIEVNDDGSVRELRPAPWRDVDRPSLSFFASVMRRLEALRHEAEMRAMLQEVAL